MSTLSSISDTLTDCVETVLCDECGGAMKIVKRTVDRYLDLTVTVAPCEDCLRAAVERGREEK